MGPGDIEIAVHRNFATGKGQLEQGSLQIVRCSTEQLNEHNQDCKGICDDLAGSFNIRYRTALSDPIVEAPRVLNTSRWPVYKQQDTAELDAYGNDDISLLVENYRVFFDLVQSAAVEDGTQRAVAMSPKPRLLKAVQSSAAHSGHRRHVHRCH